MSVSPQGYNPHETQAQDRLPRERLRAVSVGRIVLEWVLAGAVVLLVNLLAFATLERYDPNRFRVQVAVKYEILREHGDQYDSLILGDSTPNQGIMPGILDEQVGGRWLNLATVANLLAASDAWLLDEYIDRYGAPKAVLISHVPDMWAREVDASVISQAPVAVSRFDELKPAVKLKPGELAKMYLTRYAPLYSKNDSLNELLKKPWKVRDLRGGFDPDGFMPMREAEPGWHAAQQTAIAAYEDKSFKVSAINEQAMQRVIELAKEHGFTVYLLPGSVSQGLAQSQGYQGNFQAMMQQYQAWADASEQVRLILPRPQVFPDALMYDEDHVTLEGAKEWTTQIAQAILAQRSGSAETSEVIKP